MTTSPVFPGSKWLQKGALLFIQQQNRSQKAPLQFVMVDFEAKRQSPVQESPILEPTGTSLVQEGPILESKRCSPVLRRTILKLF
jgi:hypothetical protein